MILVDTGAWLTWAMPTMCAAVSFFAATANR